MHAPDDPLELFRDWLADAKAKEPDVPDAFALATADDDGLPSVRMLLLKGADAAGFVFYTNLGSRKARELEANPNAAMCFHWKSLERQVRVAGAVAPVSDAEADAYFATRDRGSQLGAWASRQSESLDARDDLEARVEQFAERFRDRAVPRPEFWSGYRLMPRRIEFWAGQPSRLHDRLEYRRDGAAWMPRRLYP